jgi:hypothetical protein
MEAPRQPLDKGFQANVEKGGKMGEGGEPKIDPNVSQKPPKPSQKWALVIWHLSKGNSALGLSDWRLNQCHNLTVSF